jgi:hydrogenase-4 component B
VPHLTLEFLFAATVLLAGSAAAAALLGGRDRAALLGRRDRALLGGRDRAALLVGFAGAVAGSGLGAVAALLALHADAPALLAARWSSPLGELRVGLDALSAFFLLCVFVVAGLAAVYGVGYLGGHAGRRRLGPTVALFNVLVLAMAGVVLARDGVMFLLAWEAMSISSFFLVTFEDEREEVRRAGTTYLIASHLGVLFLFALFALLARAAGSFGFAALAGADVTGIRHTCFLLALIGFGTKAGFWPVHTWLPDAHPAAPSHVSALMSGVMIKLGIYGLLRVLTFLGPPPAWWGATLIAVGAVSGIAGVLHALAQHDLKRLLAYHSVENIGIIALGLGLGLVGQSQGQATVAFLGYAGALLHVLNHGLFKGLLFQGAGSVLHATGTRDVESLGGLARRMPVTASTFLVGSVAICGLPPLNGFASEWLIYLGAFRGGSGLPRAAGVAAVAVLPALALIGGLAAACFVKAYGVVFLGEARTPAVEHAREAGPAMRVAMLAGAGLCLAIGLLPAGAVALVTPAAAQLQGGAEVAALAPAPLAAITTVAALLLGTLTLLALLRARLLRGRQVTAAATWGCGYAHPTPRMQYTATAFADPVLAPFAAALHIRTRAELPEGIFPASGRFEKHVGDMAGERLLVPAWRRFLHAAGRLRAIQHGGTHRYLMYILCTLVALMVWQIACGTGS